MHLAPCLVTSAPTPLSPADWDRKGGKQNGGTQKGAIELGRVTDVLAGLPDAYGRENVFVVRYTDGDVTGNAAGTREVSLCIQVNDGIDLYWPGGEA